MHKVLKENLIVFGSLGSQQVLLCFLMSLVLFFDVGT